MNSTWYDEVYKRVNYLDSSTALLVRQGVLSIYSHNKNITRRKRALFKMAIATRLGTAQKLNSSATIAPVHNTVVLYCSSTLKVMLLRTSRCPSNFDSSGRRAQSKCRCKTAMYKAVYKAYIAYIWFK